MQNRWHRAMVVSPDDQLLLLTLDEVEDDFHKDGHAVHQMPLVVLLQMNLMVMSTTHLETHEDLDVPDVEEEKMRWSTVMLSIPVKMKLLVMMDGWSLLLPGGVDGPQAGWALLPCGIRWGLLDFLFQDGSDGEVCRLLSCHPGLHDYCHEMSLSLSLVYVSNDGCCCSHLSSAQAWSLSHDGEMPPWCHVKVSTGDVYFHRYPQICLDPHLLNPHLRHSKNHHMPWGPCAPSQCLALNIVSPLSRGNFCPCLTLSENVP